MLRERIAGLHRAIVVDNADPEGLLRIRVQIPSVLGDVVSNWAWPSIPNVAGQMAPDVRSPVWVAFEDGDVDRPVWMGTWLPTRFPNAPQAPQNYILSGGINVFPVASAAAFAMQTAGDAFSRFEARADGELRWGPGSVAADIVLRRAGAGSLATSGGTLTQASVANLVTDLATHTSDIASLNTAVEQRALDATVVHLSGAEVITGVKTFSANPVFNNAAIPQVSVVNLITDLATLTTSVNARALDNTVVHLAGIESITGVKTFAANPVFNDGAIPQSKVANLIIDLAVRALDNTVVHLAGAETVTGTKTFSSNPVFNDAAVPQAKVVDLITDLAARAMDNTVVHLAGTETVTGAKTFSATAVFSGVSGVNTGFLMDTAQTGPFARLTATAFSVESRAAANVGLIVKGAVSQSADLFQVQNSAATVLAKVSPIGDFTASGYVYARDGMRMGEIYGDGGLYRASGNLKLAGTNVLITDAGNNLRGTFDVNGLTVNQNMYLSGGFNMGNRWVIDTAGGWHRSYGDTGWYNGTYGGGWYMADSTWLRAYGGKSIHTTGLVQCSQYQDHNGGAAQTRMQSGNQLSTSWSGTYIYFYVDGTYVKGI